MRKRAKFLVVSDWLINRSLKFDSKIAPILQKRGQIVRKFHCLFSLLPEWEAILQQFPQTFYSISLILAAKTIKIG